MNLKKYYDLSFGVVYRAYIIKAEKKSKTSKQVDDIISWLTGYEDTEIHDLSESDITFDLFFKNAPILNPKRVQIKGLICGIRVENIEDETVRNIRYLDKLIDELARGKNFGKIIRD